MTDYAEQHAPDPEYPDGEPEIDYAAALNVQLDDRPVGVLYQPDDYHLVIVPVAGMFVRRFEIVRREDYEAGLIIPAYHFQSHDRAAPGAPGEMVMVDTDDEEVLGRSSVEYIQYGRHSGRSSVYRNTEGAVILLYLSGLTDGGSGRVDQAVFPIHPDWTLNYHHEFPHWRFYQDGAPVADCGTFKLHRSLFLPTTRRGLAVSIEVHDTTHYFDIIGCAFALYRAFLTLGT